MWTAKIPVIVIKRSTKFPFVFLLSTSSRNAVKNNPHEFPLVLKLLQRKSIEPVEWVPDEYAIIFKSQHRHTMVKHGIEREFTFNFR